MDESLPLYVQLKNSILRQIENELNEDDRIYSENKLMEMHSVSRTTVRRALKELIDEGILYTIQGIGTFVNTKKDSYKFGSYSGFTKRMEKMGYSVTYNLLEENIIEANKLVAEKLKIDKGEKIFHLERIGIKDGQPINYTKSYIPYSMVKNIENDNFESKSLYKILKEKYNFTITRTVRYIEAALTNFELSEKLNISEGSPILKFVGFVYAASENREEVLIEYFVAFYRTDISKFYLEECANEQY